MDKRYVKQLIQMNEENKKHLELDADWILNIKNDEELGKQVRNKMLEKIKQLNEYTEQIKKQIKL